MGTPRIGQKITDTLQKHDMSRTLSDFDLCIGDIVTLTGHGLNSGGVIYRIEKDRQPRKDAVWGRFKDYKRRYWNKKDGDDNKRDGWVDPRGYPLPIAQLYGSIVLQPVFSFMVAKTGKKLVDYSNIKKRVQKVDLVAMGSAFASFQLFIQEELKRLGSSD